MTEFLNYNGIIKIVCNKIILDEDDDISPIQWHTFQLLKMAESYQIDIHELQDDITGNYLDNVSISHIIKKHSDNPIHLSETILKKFGLVAYPDTEVKVNLLGGDTLIPLIINNNMVIFDQEKNRYKKAISSSCSEGKIVSDKSWLNVIIQALYNYQTEKSSFRSYLLEHLENKSDAISEILLNYYQKISEGDKINSSEINKYFPNIINPLQFINALFKLLNIENARANQTEIIYGIYDDPEQEKEGEEQHNKGSLDIKNHIAESFIIDGTSTNINTSIKQHKNIIVSEPFPLYDKFSDLDITQIQLAQLLNMEIYTDLFKTDLIKNSTALENFIFPIDPEQIKFNRETNIFSEIAQVNLYGDQVEHIEYPLIDFILKKNGCEIDEEEYNLKRNGEIIAKYNIDTKVERFIIDDCNYLFFNINRHDNNSFYELEVLPNLTISLQNTLHLTCIIVDKDNTYLTYYQCNNIWFKYNGAEKIKIGDYNDLIMGKGSVV